MTRNESAAAAGLRDKAPPSWPPSEGHVWLAMPAGIGADFPPLGSVAAQSLAADRWERLVTEITIGFPPAVVWAALTDPVAVSFWLAEVRGEWARAGQESMLDFEDGEFFWCRTEAVTPGATQDPGVLRYLWRWVGLGPPAAVTWSVRDNGEGTTVTVTEEAVNPPSDWRSWNGMGWPGILEQMAGYLRTGTSWRWPWRRMGPYVQALLPAPPFPAWEALTSSGAVKHWLQRSAGSLAPGDPMTVVMGDASGTVILSVTRSVEAGQEFPSYLPYLEFELRRSAWSRPLGGRLWVEPAGLGRCLLQVFHYDWEAVMLPDPLEERRILTAFWVAAFRRAESMLGALHPADGQNGNGQHGGSGGPHGWST